MSKQTLEAASIPQVVQMEQVSATDVMKPALRKPSEAKNKKVLILSGIIISLIFVAILVFIYKQDGSNITKTSNIDPKKTFTSDMVLPDTALEIDIMSNSKSAGSITYYTPEYVPDELTFNFVSMYNKTVDLILFKCDNDNGKDIIGNEYFEALNGICGFEISWVVISNDNDHTSITDLKPKNNNSFSSYLQFIIYNIDSSVDTIVINQIENTNTTDGDEEEEEFEEELLNRLILGKIGEYFVELSIKLGSLKYIGSEIKSYQHLVSYARYFYSICNSNEKECKWDKDILEEAIILTNEIINSHQENITKTDIESSSVEIDSNDGNNGLKLNKTEDRRRLQNSGCSVTWYWLGDGYCDAEANNAACNFDNGDCCQHTCDDGVNWDDHNGNSYTGYTCGSNGYNCLPGCNVANPSWLGDGYCDKTGGYNTEACGYDNGDCCEDTCKNGDYTCGSNGYDCSDNSDNYCSRSQCGNECMGLCGAGCTCWTFACGDCHCHGECSEHDSYCSCDSILGFWCLNLFWVNCDNGDLAAF